jgi:hypothetical protein
MFRCCWALALVLAAASPATADLIIVEPDDFAVGADLSNPAKGLHLSTALSDNSPVPLFVVRAAADNLASTGKLVFSHVGIPFFNDIRRLRMDFDTPASAITIDYIDSGFFGTEFAHLNVYGKGGVLLQSVTSGVHPAGVVEPLSITRPTNDIQFAVAYSDGLTFGRFDFLRTEVGPTAVVPEPSTALLGAMGGAAWGFASWGRRRKAVR